MKHSIIVVCMALLAVSVFAQGVATPTPEAKDKLVRKRINTTNFLARTGGLLPIPVKGNAFLFRDAQQKLPPEFLQETGQKIARILQLKVKTDSVKAEGCAMKACTAALADKDIGAMILLVDKPELPSLLLAPESRWAIVNVAPLASDNPDAEKLQQRARRELWRASAYVLGAANSVNPKCLMKPVYSIPDLDNLPSEIVSPEVLNKMMQGARTSGLAVTRMTTYRKACLEGWAPTPTNDFQKVIWNEVKAKGATPAPTSTEKK